MKIVLAEDEGITRMWTRELLGSWGYGVVDFPDGLEALQYLQSLDHAYVAILDWRLPGLDGVEICRRLKADPARRCLGYFIMLSGESAPGHQETATAGGIDRFIAKPFESNDLKAQIEQAIRELGQRQ